MLTGEKYLAIITCIPCSKTRSFYNLIYDFCPSTLILSIHESNCERPSKDFGIGFPIMTSVDDVVPMLVDMRNDFLKKWVHINIIHDNTISKLLFLIEPKSFTLFFKQKQRLLMNW